MLYLIKLGPVTTAWTGNEALAQLACTNLNRFYGPNVATTELTTHRPGKLFWRAPGELVSEKDAAVATVSYQREHGPVQREVTLTATVTASTGVTMCMDNTMTLHIYASGQEQQLAELWQGHRAFMASPPLDDWHLDDRW